MDLMETMLSDLSRLDTTHQESLRHDYDRESAKINSPYPFFERFFLHASPQQRLKVFFDVIAFDVRSFRLYISEQRRMTVWEFQPTVHHEFLTKIEQEGLQGKPALDFSKNIWTQIASFPIEFDGPFWAVHTGKTTYILSETTDMVYRIDEAAGLLPVLHLPFPTDSTRGEHFQPMFIVDKDHQQLLFPIPSFSKEAPLTLIAIGETTNMQHGLESALRSSLKFSNEGKK